MTFKLIDSEKNLISNCKKLINNLGNPIPVSLCLFHHSYILSLSIANLVNLSSKATQNRQFTMDDVNFEKFIFDR
jgi:hypothetical protein